MQHIKQFIEQNKQRLLDELFELLRFPSVSADPQYKPEVLKAADYVAKKLREAGADIRYFHDKHGKPFTGDRLAWIILFRGRSYRT